MSKQVSTDSYRTLIENFRQTLARSSSSTSSCSNVSLSLSSLSPLSPSEISIIPKERSSGGLSDNLSSVQTELALSLIGSE